MREQLTLPLGGTSKARVAEIFVLSVQQIEHYWPQIEGLLDLDPEIWETLNTKESIFERVMDGQYQVWVVCNGEAGPITSVFFTEILELETGRHLHGFWAYGMRGLEAPACVDGAVELFAQHHGCVAMMVTGRKGWERVLGRLGWRFESITMRKQLGSPERSN